MNTLKTLQAVAIATALLANCAVTTVNGENDYKKIDAGQDVTKLLTTALADNSAYNKDISQRVCFTAIEQVKTKTVSDGTKYKFDIKGCNVDAGAASAGQCASTCTPVVDFEIKIVKQSASGSLQIKDIDRDNDSNNDNDDDDNSDSSDSSDSDDKTTVSTPTATSTEGAAAANGTATSIGATTTGVSGGSSAGSSSSTSTSSTTTETVTTPSTSTSTKAPTPKPTVKSGAAGNVAGVAAASVAALAIAATNLVM